MYFQTKFGRVGISDGMRGKMAGIHALSTSVLENENCNRNRKIAGSICEKCYSVRGCNMYPALRNMLKGNSDVLANHLIPESELPFINSSIFRFESHGDIHSSIHLQNYVNIAKRNPQTTFTLWTKHYTIAEGFFDMNVKPKNFILIYSSIMVDVPLKKKNFRHCNKIFTVYSKETIESKNIDINCGAKDCSKCRMCYTKASRTVYVREIKK
jgi:hypothetical protein